MDFEAFFREVHGTAPFPWQCEAARHLAQRSTPRITVPTGLGKSALVDAAVWAAAHGAWRRVAFVVDRRIVVDAVHERAQRIAAVLTAKLRSPEMAGLAARIGEMQVVRLRGGVFGDDDWVLHPERLTVALTTVDQLGSRLLFRGYGVSPRRWPMHAGFLGRDTLVIVDEAHLSMPFLQTLEVLRDHGAGLGVVPMSATLANATAGGPAIGLSAADRALPVVQQRLHASKRAVLDEAGPGEQDFVRSLIDHAEHLGGIEGVTRIGIIVNRVATARTCFEQMAARGRQAVLLTGRVRAADRDRELAELLPRIAAGRARDAGELPLFVVATQTVEVGADLDFDALVTECASLSALRQRFGRLDRLGERRTSQAVIVRRLAKDRDDPVYGHGLADAWEWLQAVAAERSGEVDLGLSALQAVLADRSAPAEPMTYAASLLPTHLALLAQTGPYAPMLDLRAWLHGPSDRAPDVTVIWRGDLDPQDPSGWATAAALLPPMLREALPLPVGAVRRWLGGSRQADDWGDLDAPGEVSTDGHEEGRFALRWRGPEDCAVVTAGDVRPGDTVIVPSAWGGCDRFGWAPQSTAPVADLADLCSVERIEGGATRRVVLRLAPGSWASFGTAAARVQAAAIALTDCQRRAFETEEDLSDEIDAAREALLAAVVESEHPLAPLLRDPRIEAHPSGFVVRGRGTEELEGVIETGRAITLDQHHDDVGRWARRLADTEDSTVADAVVAAAVVHDAGKADARMQALLHGSPLAAAGGPAIAKSALRRRDEQLAAWRASGMPKGFRHEFASLEHARPKDPLVRHLTATHHGYGRPWLPSCADPLAAGAGYAALSSHWLRAWSDVHLGRSPWEVAWIETLLRAADARASIEEAASEG
jgi:CRISPR-associated endonuclease/helicase Cas3